MARGKNAERQREGRGRGDVHGDPITPSPTYEIGRGIIKIRGLKNMAICLSHSKHDVQHLEVVT